MNTIKIVVLLASHVAALVLGIISTTSWQSAVSRGGAWKDLYYSSGSPKLRERGELGRPREAIWFLPSGQELLHLRFEGDGRIWIYLDESGAVREAHLFQGDGQLAARLVPAPPE
jgi:hypothetical protein